MKEIFDTKKFNNYYLYQNQKLNNNNFDKDPIDYVLMTIKDGLKRNNIDINNSAFKVFKDLSKELVIADYTDALISFHKIIKEKKHNPLEIEVGHLLGTILEDDPNYFMIDEEELQERIKETENKIKDMQELIMDYKDINSLVDRVHYFFQNTLYVMKLYGMMDGGNLFDYYLEDSNQIKEKILEKPMKANVEGVKENIEGYNENNDCLDDDKIKRNLLEIPTPENTERCFSSDSSEKKPSPNDAYIDIYLDYYPLLQLSVSFFNEGTFYDDDMDEWLLLNGYHFYKPIVIENESDENYRINAYFNFIADNQFDGYSKDLIDSAIYDYEKCVKDAKKLEEELYVKGDYA